MCDEKWENIGAKVTGVGQVLYYHPDEIIPNPTHGLTCV